MRTDHKNRISVQADYHERYGSYMMDIDCLHYKFIDGKAKAVDMAEFKNPREQVNIQQLVLQKDIADKLEIPFYMSVIFSDELNMVYKNCNPKQIFYIIIPLNEKCRKILPRGPRLMSEAVYAKYLEFIRGYKSNKVDLESLCHNPPNQDAMEYLPLNGNNPFDYDWWVRYH